MSKITPFLWFDKEAEEAARFYISVFGDGRIVEIARYGEAGPGASGSVMVVTFEVHGQRLMGLNGGPAHPHTEAFSLQVDCEDQAEVDMLWARLSEGGRPGPCGWLKDRYGLSWQIVPKALFRLLQDPDRARAQRAMAAMLKMGKIDVAELERAAQGPV